MKCSERAKRETGFSCATKAEMLKYYRCYKFSLLPFKSRSSYVIFCEVFFFLSRFCFAFLSSAVLTPNELHVLSLAPRVKLKNNKVLSSRRPKAAK